MTFPEGPTSQSPEPPSVPYAENRANLKDTMRKTMDSLKAKDKEWGGGLVVGFGQGEREALVFSVRNVVQSGGSVAEHQFLAVTEHGFKLISIDPRNDEGRSNIRPEKMYKEIETLLVNKHTHRDSLSEEGFDQSANEQGELIETIRLGVGGYFYEIRSQPSQYSLQTNPSRDSSGISHPELKLIPNPDQHTVEKIADANITPRKAAYEARKRQEAEQEALKTKQIDIANRVNSLLE